MAESADPAHYLNDDVTAPPELVDVVQVARLLVDDADRETLDFDALPSCKKLAIDSDVLPDLLGRYREKLTAMQQSLN
jgi:hypothetical protein